MDRISDLPDVLLLVILSLLPAKDVSATMVLSKRWNLLWMFVPEVELDHNMYQDGEDMKFERFINSYMPLHSAPVLERLRINVNQKIGSTVNVGARAMKRCLRELIIETDYPFSHTKTQVLLPRTLCAGCVTMLVKLRLSNVVLVDVTSPIPFPSLKKLSLLSVKYPGGDEFVSRFLSSCLVLEDLVVERCHNDNVVIFTIRVPSLESLTLSTHGVKDDALGFAIDAPSLTFLSMADYTSGFCIIEKKMPKLVKVSLDVDYSYTKQLLGSIASVEQLYLCLSTSTDVYHEGRIYSNLVRLELCVCQTGWLNLLLRLLKDSPKLNLLKLEEYHQIRTGHVWPCWSEPPRSVPKCLSSSLETFEWVQYEGREEEKQVARFIFGNSRRLKTATFYHKSTDPEEKHRILKELSMLPRSSTCQLAFKQSYGKTLRSR